MKTVRQALTSWGWEDLIPATDEYLLDHCTVGDGFPTPVVANDDREQAARLFVVCGGDVLFKLPTTNPNIRGSIYVIRDDAPGGRWEAERRRHVDENGVVQYFSGYHTPRPGPYLKVVMTA